MIESSSEWFDIKAEFDALRDRIEKLEALEIKRQELDAEAARFRAEIKQQIAMLSRRTHGLTFIGDINY